MASPLDIFRASMEGADRGRERGLAQLLGKAYSAPREQRSSILGQVASLGAPQAAFDAENHFRSMDDNARADFGRYAVAFDALPDAQKAVEYPNFARQAQQFGIPAPLEWKPEFAPNISKLAQALGGGSTGGMVQSRFVGDDGQVYALMRDGSVQGLGIKADPKTQIMEAAGGIFGIDKRTFQASPVQVGAPGRGGEVPFTIDPSLPPEIQADIRRSESAGQPWTQAPQQLPPALDYQGGGQLQAAPKQLDPIALANLQLAQQRANEPSDFERRLQMAREMGATPEQLRQMVLGSSGGGKPTATQLRQANVAKTKLIDLRAIRNQLQTVKERFEPLKGTLSAGGIYGIGGNLLSTEEGQRFDAAVDLMRQFVRKMTRTPGEGAMSDWEGRLANLANPSRGDREAVTADKIAQLEQLIDSLEQGYGAVLQDNGGNMENVTPTDAPRGNAIPVNGSDDDLIGKYL